MKFIWALVALPLAACIEDSTGPIEVPVPGRYVLKTMDGSPVPAVFTDITNFRLEFMGGVVTLKDDGTFTDSTDIRRTESGAVRRYTDVAAGTWAQVADTVKLSSTRNERYQMTVNSRELHQTLGARLLIYRK